MWWKYVARHSNKFRNVSSVVAVMCGTQPVGQGVNYGNRRCQLCNDHATDSPTHILMQCEELANIRSYAMAGLENVMPPAMKNEFARMSQEKEQASS